MHRLSLAALVLVAACSDPSSSSSGPPAETMDLYRVVKQKVKDTVKEIALIDVKIKEAEAKNDLELRLKYLREKAQLRDKKVEFQDQAFELQYKLKSFGWTDPDPLKP